MNLSIDYGAKGLVPLKLPAWEEKERISREWRSRELEELMPVLPLDEQLRLQNQIRERNRIWRRMNKKFSSSPSSSNSNFDPRRSEQMRDSVLIPFIVDALHHYNARHLGGEFDPVKPLMQSRVRFRDQIWVHINFWACSRTNSKMIKRFFAEIHYKPSPTYPKGGWDPTKPIDVIPIVEICTIIEGPLRQYKHSCGICPAELDIFHPKGCRKFVCGNDKDRIGQRIERCCPQSYGMPFGYFHMLPT